MKKYLIALPLVLIMILSMVPVMAANKTVNVDVTYYRHPNLTEVIKTESRAIEIDEAVLGNAKALKAEVEAKVAAFGFPTLNVDVQPEWTVKATVTAQEQAASSYTTVLRTVDYPTLADLVKHADANQVKVTYGSLSVDEAKDLSKIIPNKAFIGKVNGTIKSFAEGNKPTMDSRTIAFDKTNDVLSNDETAPAKFDMRFLENVEGEVTPATLTAVAYPNCYVDDKEEETFCPELCSQITVRVWDVYAGVELTRFARVYDVNKYRLPSYDGILKHYKGNYFPSYKYQILNQWNGAEAIYKSNWVQNDCTIWINVVPLVQEVNVLHTLLNCCETPDGKVQYTVWKQFWEEDVTVPFITFHSTPVVDEKTAAEWANTRLQKINATDFVFESAKFHDGINLDGYMLGNVYDVNGRLVEEITNDDPMIEITYIRSECVKDEEKVDNATVENNANTQAPVTASGTQLPATGAKDVTAFFLSAVALLGLGIFFAKKH